MAQAYFLRQIFQSNKVLYLLVFFILLSETAALSFLKEYSLSGSTTHLLLGLVFYSLVSFFLIQSFRYETIGIVNVLWSAFSVILVAATGVLIFGERLNLAQILGMGMVLVGVAVLRWPHRKEGIYGNHSTYMTSSESSSPY